MIQEFGGEIEQGIAEVDPSKVWSCLSTFTLEGMAFNTAFADKEAGSFSRVFWDNSLPPDIRTREGEQDKRYP
jgi:hypothetical protein